MTCLASKPHKSNGHMTCLVMGPQVIMAIIICVTYVYDYVLDFPCWALGSFLSVYVQEIAISGGKVRGCLEIVYRW